MINENGDAEGEDGGTGEERTFSLMSKGKTEADTQLDGQEENKDQPEDLKKSTLADYLPKFLGGSRAGADANQQSSKPEGSAKQGAE